MSMSSLALEKIGAMVYPIMLAQQAEEISESKAAELIGIDLEMYRERKAAAILAIRQMIETLPSPLILLLEGTKDQRK